MLPTTSEKGLATRTAPAQGEQRMDPRVRAIVHQLRSRLAAIYGSRLTGLVLFGSRARGGAEPASDIDVLILLAGPVQVGAEVARTGDVVSSLSLDHGVVVSCAFMSAQRFARGTGPLVRNIRREGIRI